MNGVSRRSPYFGNSFPDKIHDVVLALESFEDPTSDVQRFVY